MVKKYEEAEMNGKSKYEKLFRGRDPKEFEEGCFPGRDRGLKLNWPRSA